MSRRDELATALAQVRERIDTARAAAGRSDDVHLVAVTKTHPASDVQLLAELGITDVGENRHPEARDKRAEAAVDSLTWHFLGGIQTNKAGQIARYADVVHSVDRPKLVAALDRGAVAADRTLRCLVQVDFDRTNPGRSGTPPESVESVAELIDRAERLELAGVMAVAPLDVDPAPVFEQLQAISARLIHRWPDATIISAGMSNDAEAAIAHGATHVRIGRSILGERPQNR